MRRLALACLAALAASATASDPSPADRAAIFEAAGFKPAGAQWIRCEEDPPTAGHLPGSIELQDLNGDGQAEAWVRESSAFCYGATAEYVVLLRREAATWRVLIASEGVALPLETKRGRWPDIEVGGPTSSVVYRWDGKGYQPGP
jgi:hypothetical protein